VKHQQHLTRDISVAVQLGNIAVSMNAEGVSWNPTVARDMQDRLMSMLHGTLAYAQEFELLGTSELVEDEAVYESGDVDG